MKHPEGHRVFIGCDDGYLYEYLMNEKRIVHDFGKILDNGISLIAATFDNKYLFVCGFKAGFREFDISTHKQVNNFGIENAGCCVVTYNSQFLITVPFVRNAKLTKHLIQTKQRLHTWDSNVNEYVQSQNCSYDSKYQFIGYTRGWLGIFNIQKDKTLKNIQALSDTIFSVAFTQDNQSAFISDSSGKIKMIKWKSNASTEHDFDFDQNSTQVSNNLDQICLTRNDKNLMVGSNGFLSVFNTRSRKLINQFKLNDFVLGIKLMNDGKSVLIAEYNGDLTIINLETMQMFPSHKYAANENQLYTIALI